MPLTPPKVTEAAGVSEGLLVESHATGLRSAPDSVLGSVLKGVNTGISLADSINKTFDLDGSQEAARRLEEAKIRIAEQEAARKQKAAMAEDAAMLEIQQAMVNGSQADAEKAFLSNIASLSSANIENFGTAIGSSPNATPEFQTSYTKINAVQNNLKEQELKLKKDKFSWEQSQAKKEEREDDYSPLYDALTNDEQNFGKVVGLTKEFKQSGENQDGPYDPNQQVVEVTFEGGEKRKYELDRKDEGALGFFNEQVSVLRKNNEIKSFNLQIAKKQQELAQAQNDLNTFANSTKLPNNEKSKRVVQTAKKIESIDGEIRELNNRLTAIALPAQAKENGVLDSFDQAKGSKVFPPQNVSDQITDPLSLSQEQTTALSGIYGESSVNQAAKIARGEKPSKLVNYEKAIKTGMIPADTSFDEYVQILLKTFASKK